MNVLFLGPPDSPVLDFLKSTETGVVQTTDPLDAAFFDRDPVDFLVSHGYRHIIKPYVLDRFPRRAVNLHISYLPWNRGADPNLWSVIENTPKGVSIHYLDAGIDTGDLIAQTAVEFAAGETLRTGSYVRLQKRDCANCSPHIGVAFCDGSCDAVHQVGTGSSHRTSDREKIAHLLSLGWDTPVAQVEQAGAEWRGSQGPA